MNISGGGRCCGEARWGISESCGTGPSNVHNLGNGRKRKHCQKQSAISTRMFYSRPLAPFVALPRPERHRS